MRVLSSPGDSRHGHGPQRTADVALAGIIERIADGRIEVGGDLPSETALAAELGVSRLSVREALASLVADGAVSAQQGRRNRLAPVEQWSPLNPDLMRVRYQLSDDGAPLMAQLLEARGVLEVEIARLAAQRITEEQIQRLAEELETMKHLIDSDAEESARADIRFHDVLVQASGNAYLEGAFQPLTRMLLAVRLRTSSTREVREQAIEWHTRILEALTAHDPDAAAQAMRGHMTQTLAAMERVAPQTLPSSAPSTPSTAPEHL